MNQSLSNFEAREAAETVMAMQNQEKRYQAADYLRILDGITDSSVVVDPECRARMCKWCYQSVDFFKLSRNTAHAAMSCFDRFLSTSDGKPFLTNKSLFQLACVTALHISIKVHEPVELDIGLLVQMCRGAYTAEQIIKTEQRMLTALEWAVHPPSPTAIVHQLVALLPQTSTNKQFRQDLLELSCYQTELAIADYALCVMCSPTALALSSVLNALSFIPDITSQTQIWYLKTFVQVTGISGKLRGFDEARIALLEHMKTSKSVLAAEVNYQPETSSMSQTLKKNVLGMLSGLSPVSVLLR